MFSNNLWSHTVELLYLRAMQQVRHCHVSAFLRGLNLAACLQHNYTLTSAGGVTPSDQTEELWPHSVSFICSSTCSCASEAQADLFSPRDSLMRGFSSCSTATRVTWCSLWKSSTDFKAANILGGQRMSKTYFQQTNSFCCVFPAWLQLVPPATEIIQNWIDMDRQ